MANGNYMTGKSLLQYQNADDKMNVIFIKE